MLEKNRHILNRVIASLRQRKAPAGIWTKIRQWLDENEGQGKEHFDRAREAFRKDQVKAPDVWGQIANSLDAAGRTGQPAESNTRILQDAIDSLPSHQAPDGLFEKIVGPTTIQKEKGKPLYRRLYRISGVAATVLLLITLGLWLRTPNQENRLETITYSEETIQPSENFNALLSSFEEQDEVLAFVEANCLQIELKCENDEFKGLLLQYKELDTVKQNLLTEITLHQEQVQLIDYLIRVEKEKTEVGKKLIQYLLS